MLISSLLLENKVNFVTEDHLQFIIVFLIKLYPVK